MLSLNIIYNTTNHKGLYLTFFLFYYTQIVTDIISNITINIYNHTIQLRPPPYINTLKHLSRYFKLSLIFERCLLHSGVPAPFN